jgi:hypothetical protein
MATGVIASGGTFGWVGFAFADQTNFRTPAPATDYIPVDPDKAEWDHDPKRTPIAANTGTDWANSWVIDEDGTVTLKLSFALFHNYGQKLVFAFLGRDVASGTTHTGSARRPLYLCFEVNEAGVSTQLAGMLPIKMDIEAASKGAPMVSLEFQGTVEPGEISPSVSAGEQPVYDPATDLVYAWEDVGSATLLADGAGVESIDDIKLSLTRNPDPYRGNTGTGLPSDIVTTLGEITGSFKKLLKGTTNEMLRFITNGRTPGAIAFGWSNGGESIAITLPNAIYKTAKRSGGAKKAVVETFTIDVLTPLGAEPISYVAVTQTSGSYLP